MTERKLDVHETSPDIASQYETLTGLEPKLIATFVPSDATEQKRAFLNGEIENPDHTYNRLNGIDFSAQQDKLGLAGADLLSNPHLDPKFRSAYEAFIEEYKKKTRLQELARDFKATDGAEREVIKEEFMRLNGELYGLPDETVYRSLLYEKLILIKNKEFSEDAEVLRNELFDLIGDSDAEQPIPRFTPSPETVEWMKDTVDTLYGSMLSYVPAEQTVFSVEEVSVIFSEILDKEFGETAVDWRIDIEPAKAVTVKTTEKRIVIPDDRGELTRKKVENLIVHEIGVHVLRAIMGEETDLPLLRHGLSGYLDAEEGLGQVMEQARVGVFAEAGVNHYITAGLAYHDQKDFREAFEIKWRLNVLNKLKEGEDLTAEVIEKSRDVIYNTTFRFFRGTDELPWFKDLSYYNGAANMWKYIERIRGDDLQFMFVLLGKADPSQIEHRRIQYETRTDMEEAA